MKAVNEIIIFGGGCFWCTEAVFRQINGVVSVRSGYAGGSLPDPTYQQVCSGTSGHAEVIEIKYNALLVSLETLLDIFFDSHDPTQVNRQDNDIGSQYRSIILYNNDNQKKIIAKYIKRINESGKYSKPIVTEVVRMDKFYPAEDYHQDYYRKNSPFPYCRLVIKPKLDKITEKYINLLH